ncbi:unnamed protein product [Amoebophrya sp. A120]|nr:unnamed protein product [Amoebophrya sp. A120]|eukprot:GSA120T00005692001.1
MSTSTPSDPPRLQVTVPNGDGKEYTLPEPGCTGKTLLDTLRTLFPHTAKVPNTFLTLVDNDSDSASFASPLDAKTRFCYDPEEEEPVLHLYHPSTGKIDSSAHSGEFLLLVAPVLVPDFSKLAGEPPVDYSDLDAFWLPKLLFRPEIWTDMAASKWLLNEILAECPRFEGDLCSDPSNPLFWMFTKLYEVEELKGIVKDHDCALNLYGTTFLQQEMMGGRPRGAGIVLHPRYQLWVFLLFHGEEAAFEALLATALEKFPAFLSPMMNNRAVDETWCARGWMRVLQFKRDLMNVDHDSASCPTYTSYDATSFSLLFEAALRHQQKEVAHFLGSSYPQLFSEYAARYPSREESAAASRGLIDEEECSAWFKQMVFDSAKKDRDIFLDVLCAVQGEAAGLEQYQIGNLDCGLAMGEDKQKPQDGSSASVDSVASAVDVYPCSESPSTNGKLQTNGRNDVIATGESETDISDISASTTAGEKGDERPSVAKPDNEANRSQNLFSASQSVRVLPEGVLEVLDKKSSDGKSCTAAPRFVHLETCDCTSCTRKLSLGQEYVFYVRRRLMYFSEFVRKSVMVRDLFPDLTVLKVDLGEQERVCRMYCNADNPTWIGAPNRETLQNPDEVCCRVHPHSHRVTVKFVYTGPTARRIIIAPVRDNSATEIVSVIPKLVRARLSALASRPSSFKEQLKIGILPTISLPTWRGIIPGRVTQVVSGTSADDGSSTTGETVKKVVRSVPMSKNSLLCQTRLADSRKLRIGSSYGNYLQVSNWAQRGQSGVRRFQETAARITGKKGGFARNPRAMVLFAPE